MMLERLQPANMTSLRKDYTSGVLCNQPLECWAKPTGILCTILGDRKVAVMLNGYSRTVNDRISRELVNRGITGHIVIHNKFEIRNLAKYLSQSLTKDGFERVHEMITIYTFGVKPNTPNAEGLLRVEQMPRYNVHYDELRSVLDSQSTDPIFDGLLVAGKTLTQKDPKWYHLLPNRYIQGTIRAVNIEDRKIKSLVVEIIKDDKTYVQTLSRLPPWIKNADIARYKNDMIGQPCTVQYTTFLGGKRLSNFLSATAFQIKLGDHNGSIGKSARPQPSNRGRW